MVSQVLAQKASLLHDMKSLVIDLQAAEAEDVVEEAYFKRRWNSAEHVEALQAVRKGHETRSTGRP